MSIDAILREIRTRNVQVRTDGDKLILKPAKSVADLLPTIRERKEEIIEELLRGGPPYPDGRGRVKCFYCARLAEGSMCKAQSEQVLGVSLLQMCQDFEPASRTVH